jgi:hypothetical protein
MFQAVGDHSSYTTDAALMASHKHLVLVVDWLSHHKKDHARLHVPVVKAEIMSLEDGMHGSRCFAAGRLCSPYDVIPTSIVLAAVANSTAADNVFDVSKFVCCTETHTSTSWPALTTSTASAEWAGCLHCS